MKTTVINIMIHIQQHLRPSPMHDNNKNEMLNQSKNIETFLLFALFLSHVVRQNIFLNTFQVLKSNK